MREECERCGRNGEWVELPISHRGGTAAYHGYTPGSLCRGCHIDLLPDPEVIYTHLLESDFTFFFGAASGSARKTLRKMEEENTMVNYRTQNNGRIGEEDRHFIDCGGAPDTFTDGDLAETGDYVSSDEEYIQYVQETTDSHNDLWTLRDYPCESDVLETHNRSVVDHQQMTIDRHRDLLDLAQRENIKQQPVCVLQGSTTAEYIDHIDQHRDQGTLTDYVGIGSVCARDSVEEIADIIHSVGGELPDRCKIHGFGVKLPVLENSRILDVLDSADSCAYDYGLMMEAIYGRGSYNWKTICSEYLEFKENVGQLLKDYQNTEQMSFDSYEASA